MLQPTMAYNNVNQFCLLQELTGAADERGSIRREFLKFGQVRKIYVDPEGTYAKVYFENNRCNKAAINALRDNSYGWRVSLSEEKREFNSDTSSNCAMDDVVVAESEELYTVHGKNIPTFEAETGNLYVSLDDVRKAGLGLFTRGELNVITSKRKVVLEDFYQHMLTQASTYLLRNKPLAEVITEDTISSMIERCKKTLIGDSIGNNNRNETPFYQAPDSFRPRNQPAHRHSMEGGRQYGKKESFNDNTNSDGYQASGSVRSHNQSAGRYSMESGGRQNFKNERSHPRDTDRRYDSRNKSESRRNVENGNSDRRFNNNKFNSNKFNSPQASRNEDNRVSEANLEDEETWDSNNQSNLDDTKIQSNIQMEKKSSSDLPQKRNEQFKEKPGDSDKDSNVEADKNTIVEADKDTNVEADKGTNVEAHKDTNVKVDKGTKVEADKERNVEEGKNSLETKKNLMDHVKCYFELPKPINTLKDGDQVKIIDQFNNQLVVKTKECFAKSKEIVEYIKNLDKDTLLLNEVKEGQLIICAKDGAPNLCRAVVLKIDSPTIATVTYLDYPGEEKLSIKSLRNVDDYLAKEPICLLFTPEIKLLDSISDVGLNYIQTLIEQKSKVTVAISNDDFDLKLEDGSCLSTKLLELEKPKVEIKQIKSSEKEEKSTVVKDKEPARETEPNAKVMFGEIDSIKPAVGSSGKYVCSNFKEDELTLISMEEDVLTEFSQLTDLLQEFNDTKPYDPEAGEMCLVLHKLEETGEETWFRGVVLSSDDNSYEISSVDCGILITATKENIRSFPAYLKKINMLGVFCELVDVPDVPDVKDKLKLLIAEGIQLDVTFKSYDEDTTLYQVVVPSVYAKLKK
ncbi:unnamed protein product [Diabrotica balteata]|uniref:Tudor domain-containing protein n=1 Tax=Diabrotica balteata TaxID=107213 RepID=A0A9N9SYA6_DIABA|nr:unnamed protein product [Diabrotica balteata]